MALRTCGKLRAYTKALAGTEAPFFLNFATLGSKNGMPTRPGAPIFAS
jgi:hypothetical protein